MRVFAFACAITSAVAYTTLIAGKDATVDGSVIAPPSLLFNNDLTNIESCDSPFHKGVATTGQPFTLDMLASSVNETRNLGIDVHELAPGCCYVPWWYVSDAVTPIHWRVTLFLPRFMRPGTTQA